MQIINRKNTVGYKPEVYGKQAEQAQLTQIESEDNREVYELTISEAFTRSPLYIKWKQKAINVKGCWTTNNILDKRFRTDWEMPKLNASISVDAPILSLFGHNDENICTCAISEIVDYIPIECSLREEDNHFYFHFHLFTEQGRSGDQSIKIIIDRSENHYSHVVQNISRWMVSAAGIPTRNTPPLSQSPLYSTWYSFHQNLEENKLLEECKISKGLGCDLVIIDDGWQTVDDNRGYDYTGDWNNERFADMSTLVNSIHDIGMGIMLWYSVPFCGKKSKAYQKFQGKFLTENHHWAPVFDPRFPEVRKYLVDIYSMALIDWKIDGFKLDFIDDFKVYPETETTELNGRDTLSITQGVSRLISEITQALTQINPDVLIEFRQQYINPALRQLGNMFRAFDCPNDSLMNRVRITDVKLICGESIVHSDMITWHKDDPIEYAALQLSNLLFAVPQISVMLSERTKEEQKMVSFFNQYWTDNRDILLHGKFSAYKPLANYPILKSEKEHKSIYGLYDDVHITLANSNEIDIINGKMTEDILLDIKNVSGKWKIKVVNCMGEVQSESSITLDENLIKLQCPCNGIIMLNKN